VSETEATPGGPTRGPAPIEIKRRLATLRYRFQGPRPHHRQAGDLRTMSALLLHCRLPRTVLRAHRREARLPVRGLHRMRSVWRRLRSGVGGLDDAPGTVRDALPLRV